MINIEEVIDKNIDRIAGTDAVQMSDGTMAYTAIMLYSASFVLKISADVNSDEIVARVQLASGATEGGGVVAGAELIVGKQISNLWMCQNMNGYNDVLMIGLDDLQPRFGFLAEASRVILLQVSPVASQ